MPLHVSKFEKFAQTSREQFAQTALELCRAAREQSGINHSRYYWASPNEIVIMTDAEPGAWGPGSANEPSPRTARAMYGMADLARGTMFETWVDARAGQANFELTNK
jgi:hypothetical protein